MRKNIFSMLALGMVAAALAVSPAAAKNDKHNDNHDKYEKHGYSDKHERRNYSDEHDNRGYSYKYRPSKHRDRDWNDRRYDDRRYHDSRDNRVFIHVEVRDRDVVRERLTPYYKRHCPPGLAKKRNGCMPPGHAKRYSVGRPLPSYVEYWEVPRDVIVLLPPPPPATRYVWVDRDVLLISEATKMVIDAMVLYSAIGH